MTRACAAILLLSSLGALSADFEPFSTPSHPATSEVHRQTPVPRASADTFFRLAYDFYRVVVSPADGPRCAHRPTCSRYGLEAVRRHGAVGMLLTIDRLLRSNESSAVRGLRLLEDGETLTLHDPLEESTFWFPSR